MFVIIDLAFEVKENLWWLNEFNGLGLNHSAAIGSNLNLILEWENRDS